MSAPYSGLVASFTPVGEDCVRLTALRIAKGHDGLTSGSIAVYVNTALADLREQVARLEAENAALRGAADETEVTP